MEKIFEKFPCKYEKGWQFLQLFSCKVKILNIVVSAKNVINFFLVEIIDLLLFLMKNWAFWLFFRTKYRAVKNFWIFLMKSYQCFFCKWRRKLLSSKHTNFVQVRNIKKSFAKKQLKMKLPIELDAWTVQKTNTCGNILLFFGKVEIRHKSNHRKNGLYSSQRNWYNKLFIMRILLHKCSIPILSK